MAWTNMAVANSVSRWLGIADGWGREMVGEGRWLGKADGWGRQMAWDSRWLEKADGLG